MTDSTNPAERSVDEEAKRKALEAMRQIGQMARQKEQQQTYLPVAKALELLDIKPTIKMIKVNDKTEQCLVIPTQELLLKEYKHISGVDMQEFTSPQHQEDEGK